MVGAGGTTANFPAATTVTSSMRVLADDPVDYLEPVPAGTIPELSFAQIRQRLLEQHSPELFLTDPAKLTSVYLGEFHRLPTPTVASGQGLDQLTMPGQIVYAITGDFGICPPTGGGGGGSGGPIISTAECTETLVINASSGAPLLTDLHPK